uniref:glycine-rich domain-containing protein n=1 Tax=Algoriphagus sp. PAP.12 TaxID=2996678 RepID=UPI003FA3AF29
TPALSAGPPSADPAVLCISTPLTITIPTVGATGIEPEVTPGSYGLPEGVTATWAANVITISGTPTVSGSFAYTIPLEGPCGSADATGNISVNGVAFPITSISANNPSSPGSPSVITVRSPNFLLGQSYTLTYDAVGANPATGVSRTVTASADGVLSFNTANLSAEGVSVLTINSISETGDPCPFFPPASNTVRFGIVCQETYNADGTFYVPADVFEVTVETWGAGGGGGGRSGSDGGAGGGGGGAYSASTFEVSAGEPIGVFVGSPGLGSNNSNTNRPNGESSWVSRTNNISDAIVLAQGGQSVNNNILTGGQGGQASGGIGNTTYSGGNGANGVDGSSGYGGGGGSSAGTGTNGNNASNVNGAAAPSGGGNGGNGRTRNQNTNGLSGTNPPGGGGGGAGRNNSSRTGGDGNPGQVIITYICPRPPDPGCSSIIDDGSVSGFTVIRFDADCSWEAPQGLDEFEVLVIGQGGGGGRGTSAGGGGGGAIEQRSYNGITAGGNPGFAAGTTFTINVGTAGGSGSTNVNSQGQDGEGSSFNGPAFTHSSGTFSGPISATGGGGGGSSGNAAARPGRNGASGGGGATSESGTGTGNRGTGSNGNNGGDSDYEGAVIGPGRAGGGGGGAGSPGSNGNAYNIIFGLFGIGNGGNGGNGILSDISGSSTFFAAGGGGTGSGAGSSDGGGGSSGAGGDGNGSGSGGIPTTAGSGGGAGADNGGPGASGVVFIRYPNYRILSVEYLYFEAEYNNALRSGDLTWATAKEWENDRFEIERSVNNVTDWEKIGEVAGAGYSDGPVEYFYQDLKLPLAGGDIFYRLKQVDFDGDSTYSDTKAIQVDPMSGTTHWRVYPNPTTGDSFSIEILDPSAYRDEAITLRVIAPTGQFEIFLVDDIRSMGTQVSDWFRKQAAGVYTIEIAWGDKREYHKVILRR